MSLISHCLCHQKQRVQSERLLLLSKPPRFIITNIVSSASKKKNEINNLHNFQAKSIQDKFPTLIQNTYLKYMREKR